MLLDIGPPFFGFDRDCPYSRRSLAFLANRSLRPSLFPAILLASAQLTPLLSAAMDRVSRLLVGGAGFRHTSPSADKQASQAGHPDVGPASIDGIPASAHQATIPHWLQPPPDPQPSDRMPKSRQCRPPALLLLLLFAAKYQPSFVSSRSTLPPITRPAPREKYIMRSWQFCRRQLCCKAHFAPSRVST